MTQGFNAALSNEAFDKKRPAIAANSSLMLNAYFQSPPLGDRWAEDAIIQRAESMFGVARTVWPLPASQ